MTYVILDLEWNAAFSKKYRKYVNEIIEFGAVKVSDEGTSGILEIIDTFSMLVTPQIGKRLNADVQALTRITIEELTKSKNMFSHVLSKFIKFLGDSTLMTWGTGDILVLIDNYKYYYRNDILPFFNRYCNLQVYCQKCLNLNDPAKQLGLLNCAEILKISQNGKPLHRALTDASLSFQCFEKLFDPEFALAETEQVTSEFYTKLLFKSVYICNIKSPLIDQSQMRFTCNICGTMSIQITHWRLKNRSFIADFYCPSCDIEFQGRITLKLKYTGLTVSKKLSEKPKTHEDEDIQREKERRKDNGKKLDVKENIE